MDFRGSNVSAIIFRIVNLNNSFKLKQFRKVVALENFILCFRSGHGPVFLKKERVLLDSNLGFGLKQTGIIRIQTLAISCYEHCQIIICVGSVHIVEVPLGHGLIVSNVYQFPLIDVIFMIYHKFNCGFSFFVKVFILLSKLFFQVEFFKVSFYYPNPFVFI